ncbi:DUF1476 domain-containing protein [Magnetospirillum sp. SS-4]|uniref:DUF1476 domain-containing protein n=1 Tax=Magnetospirillum sp. SS-4 TaxID=2681465 RepID=UPI0013813DCC|nr:DUF1476 domain-containing protein [Magnetospirillum sp. SS-4]CAA7616640.1 conserved hypothetical protein [Magnetospirillum sp. SS-4]
MTFNSSTTGSKTAFDHDREFKRRTKAVKQFGLWAAGRLGLAGDAAETYAREVVMADFEEVGDDDILAKVGPDLTATGLSEAEIRAQLDGYLHADPA